MRPVILVTTDRRAPSGNKPSPRVRPYRPEVFLAEAYLDSVRDAGGVPVLAPPGEADAVDELLAIADGVVLTGGDFDIHPAWYGETVAGRLDRVDEGRTSLEIALARRCLADRTPILGICGGMQALAVAAGGRLLQDIPADAHHLVHEQPTDPATSWHKVRVVAPADRWLDPWLDANSTHHQAVRESGTLVPCGWSDDGVVEVIAGTGGFALGVQWHPELLGDVRPYAALIAAARR